MEEKDLNAAPVKNRYSDEELEEFRAIINEKLEAARKEYNALREVVMHNGDIEVEEGHQPNRTPPSVLIVPSVTHDTDNQLLIVSVSSPASIRYTLADEQGTIIEDGDATVSKTLCIQSYQLGLGWL